MSSRFIVVNYDLQPFYDTIPALLASGAIRKPKEHVTKGLDNGEAIVDMLAGRNFGKSVVMFE